MRLHHRLAAAPAPRAPSVADTASVGGGAAEPVRSRRRAPRGQVLVLFALSIFALTGMVALVIDVTWYWANTLKVQRAADAAALAGVIYLPGNATLGVSTSRTEATKNGYTNGSAGASCTNSSMNNIVVTPTQDAANPRRMNVTVSAPVPTFFMRIFGIDCIRAERNAKAEFVLPVPMGSPENYYGIDQLVRANSLPTLAVPNASGAGNLAPKGFWGAMYAKGSNRGNGDAFGSYYNPSPTLNAQYDPNGYQYTIEIPADSGSGSVFVFDPTFCATSRNPTGGYYGTGDHWVGGSASEPPGVSTYFNLWNMNETVYDWSDDTLLYASGTLFENDRQVDRSGDYGVNQWGDQNQNPSVAWAPDCSHDAYHNAWWQIPSGSLGPGIYRLQVTTTNPSNPSVNLNTNAVNNWGIEVVASGGHPRVYGSGRMCAYNNLVSGVQYFYLAQIDGIHAGKTMEISLFDPGDVGGDATLQIMSPYGGSYSAASFTYTADNGRSGSGTTLQVASGGTNYYNNSWVTIRVVLPTNYGTANITPPGEQGPGWWKIRYNVSGGNDVTTWMVGIRGNPVHLIVP